MKAQELRIGNIVSVYGKPQKVMQVAEEFIDTQDYVGARFDREIIEGVPLTEEMLKKNGFSEDGSGYLYMDLKNESFIGSGRIGIELLDANENILSECYRYVHQLQNLYFSLTQKELTFNL